MVDQFLNHMMETILVDLEKLVTFNEPTTMEEYKSINLKDWERGLSQKAKEIYGYVPANGKLNNLGKYFNETFYPLLTSGKVFSQGLFKKLYIFRVDDYDYRQMLNRMHSLMSLDI